MVAYNSVNKRSRGVGLGMLFTAMLVCLYYVPMLAWVLRFFQGSFQNPLPWQGRIQEFYRNDVTADVAPVGGSFNDDGSVASYVSYPGIAIVPETAAWTFFGWFCVWSCLAKGVATTGKVVYFSMGLPIVVLFILIGRGVSLPNAREGICLFWCEFNGDQLANGQIWQDALGQVFYSTGVGFGYFTAYASYNSQFANAVADSIIICCSNAAYETLAAFAVFGVVGYLGITPQSYGTVSSFELGFVTLPEGLAQMPAAQWWSVLFFFTLFILGMSSSFAMIDAFITTIYDTDWAKKYPRILWSSVIVTVAFLMSLVYATEFGFWLLDAIDTHTNNLALFWVVWAQCVSATLLYRKIDVMGQVGTTAFYVHNAGYILGQFIGVTVAHTVSPGAGAGVGFGIYIACVAASIFVAKTPDSMAPRFWGGNAMLNKLWWMAFYSVRYTRVVSKGAFANSRFSGQPTPPGPQHHRSTRRQWKLPPSNLLATDTSIRLCTSFVHHLLFRISCVHRRSKRSIAHLRVHLCTPGCGHCDFRLHRASQLGRPCACQAPRRGCSTICAASVVWIGRHQSVSRH